MAIKMRWADMHNTREKLKMKSVLNANFKRSNYLVNLNSLTYIKEVYDMYHRDMR